MEEYIIDYDEWIKTGIENALKGKLVRCKDCNKRYTVLCIQEEAGNINNQDDWFCADGVVKIAKQEGL